jgi:hypothetical protein
MVACTAGVPVPERFPFLSVCSGTKDFALRRENKIGADRKFEIRQARFEQIDRSAGIDRPKYAFLLQIADQLHALAIEHGLAHARDHRAVEIDAEKFDSLRAQAFNLGIDLATASGDRIYRILLIWVS